MNLNPPLVQVSVVVLELVIGVAWGLGLQSQYRLVVGGASPPQGPQVTETVVEIPVGMALLFLQALEAHVLQRVAGMVLGALRVQGCSWCSSQYSISGVRRGTFRLEVSSQVHLWL